MEWLLDERRTEAGQLSEFRMTGTPGRVAAISACIRRGCRWANTWRAAVGAMRSSSVLSTS